MAAIDAARVSIILNALLPVGASGDPGTTMSALTASPMKVRLNSSLSTPSAAGTELTGSGYSAGGQAVGGQSTASSAGSNVTVPAVSALSWTNASGGAWSIASLDITDSTGVRTFFGPLTGQPVSVANGNTFAIAVAGITVSMA